jgi:hypothetical protein
MLLAGVFATSAMAGLDRNGVAIDGFVGGDLDLVNRQAVAVGAVTLIAFAGTAVCLRLAQLRFAGQRAALATPAEPINN